MRAWSVLFCAYEQTHSSRYSAVITICYSHVVVLRKANRESGSFDFILGPIGNPPDHRAAVYNVEFIIDDTIHVFYSRLKRLGAVVDLGKTADITMSNCVQTGIDCAILFACVTVVQSWLTGRPHSGNACFHLHSAAKKNRIRKGPCGLRQQDACT